VMPVPSIRALRQVCAAGQSMNCRCDDVRHLCRGPSSAALSSEQLCDFAYKHCHLHALGHAATAAHGWCAGQRWPMDNLTPPRADKPSA
jgi:hypothetical protein